VLEINDLDKRRILRSIEKTLLEKGFTKSDKTRLIVNFFTKEKQEVNIFNNSFGNFGYGWVGAGAFIMDHELLCQTQLKEYLYIDLIDNKTKRTYSGKELEKDI